MKPYVVIFKTPEELASSAADQLTSSLQQKSLTQTLWAFPAGKTPDLFYQALANRKPLNWTNRLVHFLDEYLDVAPELPGCFHVYAKKVGALLDIPRPQLRVFNTDPTIAQREAQSFEGEVARTGLELAILGIGLDGHIAFNMPGTSFDSPTRIIEISEGTRKANSGDFGGDWNKVPPRAITMGIGTILKAKKIWLFATGAGKAEIVERTLEGPITEEVPASALRNHLDKTTFYLDEAAASKLSPAFKAGLSLR